MNTAKVYYDSDGNECTIHQMVKREPEWAASRIQAGERVEILRQLLTDALPHIECKTQEQSNLITAIGEELSR